MKEAEKLITAEDLGTHEVDIEVFDDGDASLRSKETISIEVIGPDLAFKTLSGWSQPIVVSTVMGTHSSASSIYAGQTCYIDVSEYNSGDDTAGPSVIRMLVDGVEVRSSQRDHKIWNQVFIILFQILHISLTPQEPMRLRLFWMPTTIVLKVMNPTIRL